MMKYLFLLLWMVIAGLTGSACGVTYGLAGLPLSFAIGWLIGTGGLQLQTKWGYGF